MERETIFSLDSFLFLCPGFVAVLCVCLFALSFLFLSAFKSHPLPFLGFFLLPLPSSLRVDSLAGCLSHVLLPSHVCVILYLAGMPPFSLFLFSGSITVFPFRSFFFDTLS